MYAVIAQGGKQHRVSPGDVVRLERIAGEPGDTVELGDVRLVASEGQLSTGADAANTKVVATVVEQRAKFKLGQDENDAVFGEITGALGRSQADALLAWMREFNPKR